MAESRVKKSFLNAKVNLIFYFLSLLISFFSRKIFLEKLGDDFMGLTGTIFNLLSFLNIAELGIASSIGFTLYKPLFEKNEKLICEIVSVMGYLYRWIGSIILIAGLVMSIFLPQIFKDVTISMPVIVFAFFSSLITSLLGYFINYRQTLLGADQRNYVVTAYYQTMIIIKTILQMGIVYYTSNYFAWIALEVITSIAYSFILNWKINTTYPWLKTSISLGKKALPNHKKIITNAKQIFVHTIAGMGRSRVLPFLIYAFTSLQQVAFYSNYMLLITKINQLISNFLGSTVAGVGNLIAEGDKNKIMRVFWELISVQFIVAGVCSFCLFTLIDPFISIWLGDKYVLPQFVVVVITANFFFSQFRTATDQFIQGYGLFQDVWAPIVTFIVTIGVAMIAGHYLGLVGVLLGDVASSLLIISLWKPYFLFRYGFKNSVWSYWKQISKYILILAFSWIASIWILSLIPFFSDVKANYLIWCSYAITSCLVFTIIFVTIMYFLTPGTKILIRRFTKKL